MKTQKTLFVFCIIICSFQLVTLKCFSQNWLWAKSAGGAGTAMEGWGVTTDAAGNVYVTGVFGDFGAGGKTVSIGTTTLTSAGNTDIFIAKYDAAGTVLWAKRTGGTYIDESFSIAADAAGNAYITGEFQSPTITFGSTTLTSTGINDFFIAKYSPTGTMLWAQGATGGPGYNKGNSVAVDTTGNVYVAGAFSSPTLTFGTTTLTNSVGSTNFFLVKYTPSGTVLWAKNIGIGAAADVAVDAAGNAYITGYFISTITFGSIPLTSTGAGDIFLVKYDSSGNVIWGQSAGGTNYDEGYAIAVDAIGNSYITGYFSSPSITFGTITLTHTGGFNINPADFFIAKYDSSGNAVWAKSANGTNNDFGYSLAVDACNNVNVIGNFISPSITFGTNTLPDASFDPMFIVQYSPSGTLVFASELTSGGDDKSDVATDAFGNIYIVDDFAVTSFTVGTNTFSKVGSEDLFLAKYVCSIILSANSSQTNISCNGGNDGIATVTVSGGTSPYTYLWSNSKTTQMITGLIAGTYSVIVADASNDTTKAEVIITQPATLTLTVSQRNIDCNSLCNGSVTATPSGGTAGYSYLWSTNKTTAALNSLCVGNYTVTVTDNNSCTVQTGIVITQPMVLGIYVSSISVTCNGTCNGSATAGGTGGTMPYTFLWSNSKTTATINNLCFGIYSVTVTDNNGCMSTNAVTISEPAIITLSLTSTNAGCGQANGSVSANASGGTGTFSYSWSNGDVTSQISNLASQIYSVTVTDNNGCTKTGSVNVNNIGGVTAQIISSASVTCNGACNGSATAGGTGGTMPYTFLWSNGKTTATVNNLCFGVYSVTVTDNSGCMSTNAVTISEPAAITLTITFTDANCGQADGSVLATASGGTPSYTYVWSNGSADSTVSNLFSGLYTLTVTDSNGCTKTGSGTIFSLNTLTIAISGSTTIQNGDSTVLSASGGIYYQWYPTIGLNCTSCTNPIASPIATTLYCVTVTDMNGCSDSSCVTVNVEPKCEELFIPTAFSPNGDNNNDYFRIYGANNCFKKFYLAIFDRWGEKVFTTNDPAPSDWGWDGTYKSKELNTGIFVYYLNAITFKGEEINRQGNISLIR